MIGPRLLAAIVAAMLLGASSAPALSAGGTVEALVKDDAGAPVADAVVSLTAAGGGPATRPPAAVMDQINKTFVPHVLPVQVGAAVSFPNRDNIRHHVYSFSAPKRFELPLYIGTPAAPVVFDTPGVVPLGCNIHDWMLGYIYVLATPHFGRTGPDGLVQVADLPPGTYEARVWHPRMRGETEKTATPVVVEGGGPAKLGFVLSLKPERRPAPPQPRSPYESNPQS